MTADEAAENYVGFPERLKMALGTKSSRAFAMECGMSATVMHQYLSGKSEPSRLVLISIAKTSGVNLHWLLTGEGEMRRGGKDAVPLDADLLEAVTAGILPIPEVGFDSEV